MPPKMLLRKLRKTARRRRLDAGQTARYVCKAVAELEAAAVRRREK